MKKNGKKIIIGTLAIVSIGGILSFNQMHKTNDIILSKESISNTKTIAMYQSEDGTNYTEINEMPSSGYTINESKSYCTTDNKTKVTGKLRTENGKHIITNLKKSDKCYVWFDKAPTAGETILAGITVKTNTPDFSKVATTNEGIFKAEDGMYGGTSYYWRGAVTNNYVKFANYCWRIVRINGDGSIRVIYDGSTCHANGTSTTDSIAITNQAYNLTRTQPNYVGWTYAGTSQRPNPSTGGTASNAKTQLESWYDTTIIGANAEKVADGKFCNDRTVTGSWVITGTTLWYKAYLRIITNRKPSLECDTSDRYTLKVGLITADETMFAGGLNANNKAYYLYNGQDYWTMSPSYWSDDLNQAWIFYVNMYGNIDYMYVNNGYGLRPVINLRSDVTISSGDGTQNNPFVVS